MTHSTHSTHSTVTWNNRQVARLTPAETAGRMAARDLCDGLLERLGGGPDAVTTDDCTGPGALTAQGQAQLAAVRDYLGHTLHMLGTSLGERRQGPTGLRDAVGWHLRMWPEGSPEARAFVAGVQVAQAWYGGEHERQLAEMREQVRRARVAVSALGMRARR